MAEPLEAELNLSIDAALANVEQLGTTTEEQLAAATASFESAMAEAVTGIPEVTIDPDVSAVEPAITGALDAVDTAIPIEADAAEVTPEVQAALDVVDNANDVIADATGVTLTVDEALAAVDAVVQADVDAAALAANVDAAVAGIDTTIEFDADTTQAVDAVEQLGSAAQESSGGVANLEGASAGLQATTGLATGSTAGLAGAVGGLGGNAGLAVGGIAALGGAVGLMIGQAVDATGSQQRFASALGSSADAVEHLSNIKGLNTDLSELALTLGSDDDNLRNAASSMYQFATGAGHGADQSSLFVQQTIALSARAVALKPQLGDVGDVSDRMATALGRGGKAAAKMGIDLAAADINARAQEIAGLGNEVTIADKQMAGAQLAFEKYGSSIKTNIEEGAKNAVIEQRRLRQTIQENIEAAGMPLVMPIFDVMKAGIPVIKEFGVIVSEVAQAGIPLLSIALELVLPFITAFADGLKNIGPGVLQVIAIFAILYKTISGLPALIGTVSAALSANPYVILAAGIVMAVGALGLFSSGADEGAASASKLSDAVKESNGVFDESAAKITRDALQRDGLLHNLEKSGVAFKEYTTAMESSGGATDRSIAKARDLAVQVAFGTVKTSEWVAVLRGISPELGTLAQRLAASGQLSTAMALSMISQAKATHDGTSAIAEQNAVGATNAEITKNQANALAQEKANRDLATAAVNAYKQALDDLSGRALSLVDAQNASATAAERVTTAFAQQVDESHTAEQVERGRIEAIAAQVRATEALATATYDSVNAVSGQAAAQAAADGVMQGFTMTLHDNGLAAGQTAGEVDAFLIKMGLIPAVIDGVGPSIENLGRVEEILQTQTNLAAMGMTVSFQDIATGAYLHMGDAATAVATKGGEAAANATTAGHNTFLGWSSGLDPIPGDTKTKVGAAGPAIDEVAGQLAQGQALGGGIAVGKAFGTGMVMGIGMMTADIAVAAAEAVGAAVDAAKAKAKIDSPSKVFAEIGGNLGMGLAVGLDDSARHVIASAEKIIGSAAGAFPQAPSSQGGTSTTIAINVNVYGVSDERLARTVGGEVVDGGLDALATRGVIVAARTG